MKKSKKKHKLALGAYLKENQEPLAKGAQLAGSIVQASGSETNERTSVGGLALSRAGQGAQLGSSFGPWGTLIGGVVGGAEGVVEGELGLSAAKQRIIEQNASTNALVSKQLVNNSKNSVAKGGKLASKLGVIKGGELNQISPDAVEVKANNPGQTDSVELQDAYVDHDEVIDDKNRVFSEELGFAKYAKKLEKQKSTSSRFTDANQHIDNKLDELFQIQEQTKEGMKQGAKTHKAKGGYLRLTGPFPMKTTTKAGFDTGGKVNVSHLTSDDDIYDQEGNLSKLASVDQDQDQTKPNSKFKFDLNKGVTALSTFGPNVVSALAQSRLKGPVTPQLEKSVSLQRVNPNAQLAQADTDANQANQLVKNNTAQASDIASATGNILAKKFGNKNAIYGQNQQINAEIQHQEAGLNTGIGMRNTERINAVNQGQADFSNLKQRLTSENAANLAGKFLQQGHEYNQMQLDKEKGIVSSYRYRDSGVQDRWTDQMKQEFPEDYKKLYGKALGGKLSNRPIADKGQLEGILGLYSHPEPHNAWAFENNEPQNLQAHKEKSKHGKSSHKLVKGGYLDMPIDIKGLYQKTEPHNPATASITLDKGGYLDSPLADISRLYQRTEPHNPATAHMELAKGGYVGGGETPNDPKPTPQKLSANDFKRISWKSMGLRDSTGRGSMYQTTYGALNQLNKSVIPQGSLPTDQTFVANPTGLDSLLNPKKSLPAYNIAGSVAPQAGAIAHFKDGGMMGLNESLGDPRHVKQASKAGLSKGGIHIKKSHKGLLHKNLGVKAGHKIPASKLAVHKGDSAALKKRKVFAQNAKKWHHEEGGKLGARKSYADRIF
jgi:hypothetical protein